MNLLALGDNLEIMKEMASESVDLIYLDPPFFSNRNYEIIWGDKGEIRSFQDRWSGGVDHYIAWLKERVVEMHRLLKPTGSIFLHCDYHANSYIRVYILDKVFGENNFRNEIIWKRTGSHNSAKRFGPIHDTIYFYSKSENYFFQRIPAEYSEEYQRTFNKENTIGNYKPGGLTGPATRNGESGQIWKDYNPTAKGRHWAIPKSLRDHFDIPYGISVLEVLDFLDEKGFIVHPENKNSLPSYKQYLHLSVGLQLQDIILDIPRLQKTIYPTQKPEKLLERIILCASNEGDTIFDPFVGGGTTVVVAEKLKRNWVGIDQSVQAVKVTEMRLSSDRNLFANPFVVKLHKYDYDTLFNKNPFEFETWIIEQFGGIGNIKQKSDSGIDGKTRENIPIQVKQSENIGRNVVDNFASAVKRFDKNLYERNIQENKIAGYIIAFSFGKGAIQEIARLQNEENVLIKLLRVDEIVPISVKPKVRIEMIDKGETGKHLREIEFVAKGEVAEGKHIEFFAWDFNFNENFCAEILRDPEGSQTRFFKSGEYKIAVKVIDDEGLENMEIIKLKVNGKLEKS